MKRSNVSLLLTAVACGLSVLVAVVNIWPVLAGGPATRNQIVYVVVGGPALIIGASALVLLLRDVSRHRDDHGRSGGDAQ